MMHQPGDIVEVQRHCGAWTSASEGITPRLDPLHRGDLVIVLGQHPAASALRGMTMLEILHRDTVLIVDERHLRSCNRTTAMV